jgi:hypothetical protein
MLLFEFFRCFFLVDFPGVEDDCVPLVALCADEPFWSIELPAALEPELSFDVPVVVADWPLLVLLVPADVSLWLVLLLLWPVLLLFWLASCDVLAELPWPFGWLLSLARCLLQPRLNPSSNAAVNIETFFILSPRSNLI